MNRKHRIKSPPFKKGTPIVTTYTNDQQASMESPLRSGLKTVLEETKNDFIEDTQEHDETTEAFKSEVERFIEISKYFSSPLRKTASYVCEDRLISYPNPYRMEYKRGGVTTYHIKFCNLILEPVYIKLYKLIPDLEEIKFINLSLSRCKRIPPGLSFNLGFVYDDVNEKPAQNAKMIFVASRKSTTPCYQICEIDLNIDALKIRR
ncbi:unnamed protein product [Leptosia nina]|uniref:Major sperm protein n=1 Tax=Leptosia nina TaxID=320188 RepID=A0AAV1JTB3_9NEOP